MPDLGLEISPRIMGHGPLPPLSHSLVRVLTMEDIPLLDAPREFKQDSQLKRISERHHALARFLAQGGKVGEAAAVLGYLPVRVSILKADPAFQELIAFYRTALTIEQRSNFERLAGLTADAADLLQERMEENPEKIPTDTLVSIVKLGADRTGLGPQSSSVTVNVTANLADKMKIARERARAASEPKTIEGEVLPPKAAE